MLSLIRNWAVRSLVVILLLIFTDILCENFIVILYNDLSKIHELLLLLIFMLLQIGFAPLQSGLSDFIGRKKSIVSSLGVTLVSILLTLFFVKNSSAAMAIIIVITLLKGSAGNTIPLALAAIADTQGKNYRISFALSSATYAVAYLVLTPLASHFRYVTESYFLIGFLIFLVFLTGFLLKDREDSEENLQAATKNFHPENEKKHLLQIIAHEPKLIKQDLAQKDTREALSAFFLWEVSMYTVLVSQIDFKLYHAVRFTAFMMLGYLTGVAVLFFLKKIEDSKIIKIGYIISTMSLLLYFLLFSFFKSVGPLLKFCYFLHASGNAFLSPALMSVLAKEKPLREQGKRYGLVDSVDTVAYLVATLFGLCVRLFELQLFYLVLVSFLSFLFSWRFYGRFQGIKEYK